MKPSISTWSFYGNWNLEQKLRLAKEAGFAGFEIDLTEDGPVNLKSSDQDLKNVRSLADKVGIQLSGLASVLFWGASATSDDATVRERAAFILRREIECAHGLGLDVVLLVPGMVAADWIPDCPIVRYDVAYKRAQEFVRAAVPQAEKLGVTIGIENVWNKFLLSPLEMRDFIDSFKSDRVGAYFDVGNVLAMGYPEHWIEILGPRIKRVHFKDFRRAVGTVDGFVDLLSGDVNWPAVVKALNSIRYDGWVTAEMIPPVPFYKHSPETLIHNTARSINSILKLKQS